jgi:transcriptional regulator with XRE-family HTH domain
MGEESRTNPEARKIGQRLSVARERAGLTQDEVARALNIAIPTYRHYEKGRHLFPTDLLKKLPPLLHMPVTYFLGMPDPEGLSEWERALVETARAIRTPRVREGLLDYARGQLTIEQSLTGRADQSALPGACADPPQ